MIHTGKNNCKKRCENLESTNFDENNFPMQIRSIVTYLENKNCLIHINGNHSVDTVKTELWARVLQNQR